MPRLELALLGPLTIRCDGRPLALPYDKVRALLVYLAAQPDRAHRRGAVADLLWPDQPEAAARHSLSQALTSLRQALAGEADALLTVSRQDIAFTPAPDTLIDVVLLSSLLNECDRHPHRAAGDCAHCARQRMRIAELYRGPFLADLAIADSPPFADWTAGTRLWLHERVACAVSALADYCERQGDHVHALGYARRQIEIDPLCEDGHRRVMRRLAAAGERSAALAHYAACRDRLAADADLEPEPATVRLCERIRGGFDVGDAHPAGAASASGLTTASRLPAPATPFIGREAELAALQARLDDRATRLITLVGPGGIGKTRLALQAAADHVERLTAGAAAAGSRAHATSVSPEFADLVSDAAVSELTAPDASDALLDARPSRGHVGAASNLDPAASASASASAAAAARVDEAGPVARRQPSRPRVAHFISFAAARSLDQCITAIADALGLRLHGAADPRAHLLDYLGDTNLLLVFDNVEHLEQVALFTADLLARAPAVHVLVTSRERLAVQGEVVFDVDGLEQPAHDDPDASEIERCAATHLFVDRMRRARAGVAQPPLDRAAITRICRLVDGMPLAIELAAAWTPTMSCADIARELERSFDLLRTELRDVPPRQRSVRAAFDHSWARLAEDEHRLFEGLSVFRGGFTREAVEAVCDCAQPGDRVARLAAKSLVRVSPGGRADLHELLRQYGDERLDARPQDAARLRARHLDYFVRFLAAREPALKGREHDTALVEIARELGNIRAAWRWAIARRQSLALTPAVDALFLYFAGRGHVREILTLFGGAAIAMEADGAEEDDARARLVGRLRRGMAGACLRLGYYDRAREYLADSLARFRRLGAAQDEAFALNLQGGVLHMVGEYDAEHRVLEDSIRLGRAAKDEWITAYSLTDLALALSHLGNHRAARRLCEESLAILQRLGDPRGLAFTLTNLGIVSARLGEVADAQRLHEHSLALRRAAGDEWGAAVSLRHLGRVFRQAGEQAACERCLTESLRLARALRTWPLVLDALTDWAYLDADTGRAPRARDIAAAVLRHPASTPATRASACLLLDRFDAGEAARAGRAAASLRALDSSDVQDEATARIERLVNELLADADDEARGAGARGRIVSGIGEGAAEGIGTRQPRDVM